MIFNSEIKFDLLFIKSMNQKVQFLQSQLTALTDIMVGLLKVMQRRIIKFYKQETADEQNFSNILY